MARNSCHFASGKDHYVLTQSDVQQGGAAATVACDVNKFDRFIAAQPVSLIVVVRLAQISFPLLG